MKSPFSHDIIVIGAGAGGLSCAAFMKRAGFRALLIDETVESFGGDCLNAGCVPSKALLHVANLIHSGDAANRFRSQQSDEVDMRKVMQYVRNKQATIRAHENPEHFKNLGLDIAIGTASFIDKQTVDVNDTNYRAKHIVIATGSRPRQLELPGLDSVAHYTNETIFSLETLPKQFVFIGGGPINVELGQAFSRLGSKVTILQAGKRILDKEAPEVSQTMQTSLENEGIAVYCNAAIQQVSDGKIIFTTSDTPQTVEADAVFVGVGRQPNLEKLKLEAAGVRQTEHGKLQLDNYLRTTNKAISTVGDAAGQHLFTHAAELQAATVLRNFFSPVKKRYSTRYLAWTTFCDPEISTFGHSKQALDNQRTRYREITVALKDDDRAIVDDADGFLQLYVSRRGKLLGGTMIGPRAGEIVSELLLLMRLGKKLSSVLGKTYPYPIASRAIQTAARQYSGQKLSSPLTKRLLRVFYH